VFDQIAEKAFHALAGAESDKFAEEWTLIYDQKSVEVAF
jgi:hypothetical protein